MAILTATAANILTENYGSLVAGQAAGFQTPNIAGDSIPLVGSYVLITIRTAGTGGTVTFDSVELSNFGQDNNPVVTMASTDEQDLVVKTDNRFKQVSGNVGYLNLTYSSVTTMTIKVKYIP